MLLDLPRVWQKFIGRPMTHQQVFSFKIERTECEGSRATQRPPRMHRKSGNEVQNHSAQRLASCNKKGGYILTPGPPT